MKKIPLIRPRTGSFAKITSVEGKRAVVKPSSRAVGSVRATSTSLVGKTRYAK